MSMYCSAAWLQRELVKLLKSKIDNIEDVVGFYHSMRSDLNPTSSPVFHVDGDYTATSAKKRGFY